MARFPKSVTPGDPIPTGSEAWNAILVAAHEHRQASRPDAPPARGGHGGVVWALALNSTGANLPPYKAAAVTAAGGIDVSGSDPDDDGGPPWQRRPVLTLGEPAAVTDWVCVTLEAIPDGEFGRVAVSGVVLCDVDSASGAKWARPQVGDTTLLGGATGTVRVLHVPSGGGSQRRCVVYLHERPGAGEACGNLPLTFRVQIGTSVTRATVSGTSVVTGVTQRFRDITITADGCFELGEPYCEAATTDACVVGEDPGPPASPSWYCVEGACSEYFDGIIPPTYDAGPFASKSLCVAGCPAEGGTPSCCPGAEYATLFATLSGGLGTKALNWTGTAWESAPFALPCAGDGVMIVLRFSTACELTWSNDGGETFTGITPAGSTACGPPLSSTGWGFAPGGSCGTITVTVESP